MKRARREIKRLKTYLGWLSRDLGRKLEGRPELAGRFAQPLARVGTAAGAAARRQGQACRRCTRPRSPASPRGKAHKRYEFGAEVSVAVTNREGLVVGMQRIGRDGVKLPLQETIAAATRAEAIKGQSLERVSVDTWASA